MSSGQFLDILDKGEESSLHQNENEVLKFERVSGGVRDMEQHLLVNPS